MRETETPCRNTPCVRWAVAVLTCGLLAGPATPGQAQIIPAEPFKGNVSEMWETFPNYLEGGFHLLSNPTPILGGLGEIFNTNMTVYEPFAADALLGLSGFAQTTDGVRGLQVGNLDPTATLTFAMPVARFGAFWGAETLGGPTDITVEFFDPWGAALGAETFSYDHEAGIDGRLDWHGWGAVIPVGSVRITGNNFVMDGLQAMVVPEGGALTLGASLVGTALGCLGAMACRKHRDKALNPKAL